MKTKNMPAVYSPEEEAGFTALVSVFNNVDLVGDVVRPGAFKDSIAFWKNSGDPIPVYWSHRMDDPHCNIGAVVDIEELSAGDSRIPQTADKFVLDNGGLWVKAKLDTEGTAAQVRHLLSNRRVKQFSFAYDVIEERAHPEDGVNELLKLWIHEVGPTPLGANPLTALGSAKSADPDPPPEPEPGPPAENEKRRPSALFLRLHCEIALAQRHLTD